MTKKTFIAAIFLLAITTLLNAQCIKGDQSKFTANPENKVNSVFNFDYQIYSNIEYKTNGETKRYKTHYYVNSRDGSLFFPEGILGMNHFGNDDNHFKFDGAVWLANRQLIIYLYDEQFDKKRAYTVDSKKSASDNFMNQHLAIMSFFNDREDPEMEQENPEPLPPGFDWDGITHGYTGYIYNGTDRAKMTIYLEEHPMLAYKTSVPLAGFLTGVLNFFDGDKCNDLAVFNKIEMENGDYIQEELYSINPEQKTFNGSSYKPFGLPSGITSGSGTGMQNVQAKMAEFQQKQTELAQKIQLWQEKKKQCSSNDDVCKSHYKSLIDEAKKEGEKLACELAKSMGVGDMMEDCN